MFSFGTRCNDRRHVTRVPAALRFKQRLTYSHCSDWVTGWMIDDRGSLPPDIRFISVHLSSGAHPTSWSVLPAAYGPGVQLRFGRVTLGHVLQAMRTIGVH